MKTKEKILEDFGCPEIPFSENVEMFYPAILSAMDEFAQRSNNELIDNIIIDLTKRGFLLNPSKMKSQMLEVIRSHKNSDVESDGD